jgi:acetyl-CoA carboxylase/biotin carboxylase 1
MVSGVNIPAAQLQIAMGIPLHNIRDIRLMYSVNPSSNSIIDFDFSNPSSLKTQRKPSPKGHVIAARITAENPDAGFKPNSGKVTELNFRSNSNVWGYFSVDSSGGVHEFADSQFGHIFSYGETRDASRKNLIVALKELSIRGDFRTTVEFLIKLLENDEFVNNQITTGWLDNLILQKNEISKPDRLLMAVCGAVSKAYSQFESNTEQYRQALDKGQVPNKDLLKTAFDLDFIYNQTRYKMKAYITSPETVGLSVNGSVNEVYVKRMVDDGLLLSIGGQTHYVYTKEESHRTTFVVDNKTCYFEKENDPTKLRSPSPGKLVRYMVQDGAHIKNGDAYAEIEVMKMYMPLLATESGVITTLKPAGSILSSGDVIAKLVLDDPSKVQLSALFDEPLPEFG